MNNLCAEIGYKSINHAGEQLCGDHVEVIEREDAPEVIVLADGLGSGVKASILSTLTSKIISTMIAEGLPLETCVSTIAKALPVSSDHGVAYSTFTVIRLIGSHTAEIIRYDNPDVIFIRNGELFDFPKQELNIDGKRIFKSVIRLQEDDVMVAMSDGCPYAGTGASYNYDWKWEDIAAFMQGIATVGYTAKTLATMLVDQTEKEYGHEPGDDATACVVRIRKRAPVNVLFGPPRNPDDVNRMMSLFFSKEGKRIICGGTTASIAAKYLRKPLRAGTRFFDREVPPTSELEGTDLVTEGVITMSRVIEYAKDALGQNELYEKWSFGRDGASMICRLLFEEATDISFYVGRAVNPAHQNPELPVSFHLKMNMAEELAGSLRKMGKRVTVSYF